MAQWSAPARRGGAFRGFNPIIGKSPATIRCWLTWPRTGHILRLKNRRVTSTTPKQAVAFVRELIDDVRAQLGRRIPLEFRMDAAFCQPSVFRLLAAPALWVRHQVAVWHWLPLKQLAAECRDWQRRGPNVDRVLHTWPSRSGNCACGS